MADVALPVTAQATPHNPSLNILAVAHLPFYSDGEMTFNEGGTIFNAELLPGLAKLGHTVRVVAQAPPTHQGQKRTGLRWDLPNLTVEWFALDYRSGSTSLPAAFLATEKRKLQPLFDRLVREQRPDVVIIGRQALIWNVLDLCHTYRLPSLLIPHSSPIAALLFDTYSAADKQALVDRFRQVDCIIAVAKHLEELLRQVGLTNIRTIPNTIADPVRFRPEPKDPSLLKALHLTPQQLVVGHFSNLRLKKRPLDIVSSAEFVLRSSPDTVYLIVGDGPCRREMEELSRQKGLTASFRYVGEIAHEQVPRYLNLSDIVVLPSEREGFPLVYREAQACGRVLLVSDIPSAHEAVSDGETGVLFRLGDVQDLAAKTLALAQDPGQRHRIGEQARAAALTQTPEQWVRAYEEVLRQIVGHHSLFLQREKR